jgi:DNA-binding MarR family transcriptional regulator
VVAAREDRVGNLLGAVSLAVADAMREAADAACGQGGATPAALVLLHQSPDGRTVGALHDALGVTPSGAVRTVDRLVDAGWARRAPGADHRSIAVSLTRRGHRVAERVLTARAAALADFVQHLDDDSLRVTETVLERLVATRARERLARRRRGEDVDAGWLCRLCDFEACERDEGRCPAARAASGETSRD